VLDVSGPVQAFASCLVQKVDGTRQPLFELCSIAECVGIIKPGEGPPSYAEYSFADAPDYDILLIPGGFGTRAAVNNDPLLKHVAETSHRATTTTTVCTGSALLARTDLLDGRQPRINLPGTGWCSRGRESSGGARRVGSMTAISSPRQGSRPASIWH
jgi:transcriptional regulator GlxA family with amidase domain